MAVILLLLTGEFACQSSASIVCGDLICPAGTKCSPDNTTCVLEGQLEGCQGITNGTNCFYQGGANGLCIEEVCYPSVCGDGFVDQMTFEGCDEGDNNSNSPDATCRTNCQPGRCSDGIIDIAMGENCDDGNLTPGDGCSGACIAEVCGNGIIDLEKVGNSFLPSEECDDGANGLNHDGCAALCRLEQAQWDPLRQTTHLRRTNHAMAYDVQRARTVVFGGDGGQNNGRLGDTWEWDGISWTSMNSLIAPSARINHAMSYDLSRGRTILFGGVDNRDTWEWDGSDWIQIQTEIAPQPRWNHTMAYDAGIKKIILFGGTGQDGTLLDDTWVWDGAQWTLITTELAPSPRENHAMAYDPKRGRVVLFGGKGTGLQLDDTWEWDGVQWQEIFTELSPSARYEHAISYDAVRERIVLSGGQALGVFQPQDDFWEWDGSAWSEITRAIKPGSRIGHTMTYDAARAQTVIVGGLGEVTFGRPLYRRMWEWDGSDWTLIEGPSLMSMTDHKIALDVNRGKIVVFGGNENENKTWEWDGVSWTEILPNTSPGPRTQHAMAYDPARGRVILFGGGFGSEKLGDTWEWDGSDWTEINTINAPSPRRGHAMVYDASRNQIILFGGSDENSQRLNDTWKWDRGNWTEIVLDIAPEARSHHAMAFDVIRKKVVLYGGDYTGLNRTWEWDGVAWTPIINTDSNLQVRSGHAMAYHALTGKVLLYGGTPFDNGSNLWEWDGELWAQVMTSFPDAGARSSHAMIFDTIHGNILMLGGRSVIGIPHFFSDTWTLKYSSSVSAACEYNLDGDSDGKIGCADPDCWGRCTPQCPPYSTPDWPNDCDTTLPHCGDGTCNTFLENSRLCPMDCGSPPLVCGDFFCDQGETAADCPGDC